MARGNLARAFRLDDFLMPVNCMFASNLDHLSHLRLYPFLHQHVQQELLKLSWTFKSSRIPSLDRESLLSSSIELDHLTLISEY